MTTPLTDQPSRADLIAELYDRHAAGLFAYCADQLGDLGVAADAVASVLHAVTTVEPPRAALYALARREIHRRDVVYSPPVVDPLVDPASALVERTLRELRPHQREVLLLCEVCRLERAELAWVLDVAVDTADELAVSAGHRFRQTLETALASTGARVPKPVADVYGALGVAPPRDILGRLPWPAPPPSLRFHFAGSRIVASSSASHTAPAAPLFVKPLWPVPPTWPLPLGEPDPATSTGLFPTELLTPPAPHPAHEETTAPMPKIGYRPTPRMMPLSAPVPADVLDDDPVTQDLPAIGDVLVASAAPGSLFRPPPREPVYRMPEPVAEEPPPVVAEPAPEPVVRRPIRVRKERHYDWAWELIGFLACVAIALAVFFSIPSIVHP